MQFCSAWAWVWPAPRLSRFAACAPQPFRRLRPDTTKPVICCAVGPGGVRGPQARCMPRRRSCLSMPMKRLENWWQTTAKLEHGQEGRFYYTSREDRDLVDGEYCAARTVLARRAHPPAAPVRCCRGHASDVAPCPACGLPPLRQPLPRESPGSHQSWTP